MLLDVCSLLNSAWSLLVDVDNDLFENCNVLSLYQQNERAIDVATRKQNYDILEMFHSKV